MRESAERVAVGGLALSAALLLFARPQATPLSSDCPRPREIAEQAGQTRVVRCGGDGAGVRGPARLLFGQKLDLNCSDADALEALPGIGPARAREIVHSRCRAPFSQPEELVRVRGIGPKTLERLAGWVEVREPVGGDEACRKSCL